MIISTGSLAGYGLHHAFSLVRDAGFHMVNLDIDPANHDTLDAGYTTRIAEECGVCIESVTAPERGMSVELFERIESCVEALGVKHITYFPPTRFEKDIEWFTLRLPETAKKKRKTPLRAVANVEPKTVFFVIPEYRDATLQAIKKTTGATVLDVSRVDPESGIDLLKSSSLLWKTVKQVYLSDRSGAKTGIFPGAGEAPLESLLIKMRDAGYAGQFVLRVSPSELSAGKSDEAVIARLQEARAFWERYFQQTKETTGDQ